MIKRDVAYFFVMFILFSSAVYAEGTSGIPYKFFDVPSCYGDIYLRVNEVSRTGRYGFPSCQYVSGMDWKCPCQDALYIITENGSSTHFNIMVQYNIGQPRNILRPNIPPSTDEQYNDNLKRIVTLRDIIIVPSNESISNEKMLQQKEVLGILIYVLLAFVIIVVVIGFIFFFSDVIKRWFDMEEDEKLTFGGLLKAIFSRPKIERKVIGKSNENVNVPVEKKETKQSNSVEEEARRILEEIGK
jgi:hypothetical protein